jgi:hypothetical protein
VKGEGFARGAVSLAWGLVVAAGAYAILRSVQGLRAPPGPNPATVVWSAHAGFFWRSWTAGYIGGMGAVVASTLARGRLEAMARALLPAVVAAAALLVVATMLFP